MSTDLEVLEGEKLLKVVLVNQPRNWNNKGYRKLNRHLKKTKTYLPGNAFDSIVSLSQRVWNIFVKVTTDAEIMGSWTTSEMTLIFKEVVSLNYLDFFDHDLSVIEKEGFGENIIFGLHQSLASDLEAGHQHFLFLLCCCLYYGSENN